MEFLTNETLCAVIHILLLLILLGLSVHRPNGPEDLLRILQYGNSNRRQHPTDANKESSRSHAVFQVYFWTQFCTRIVIEIVNTALCFVTFQAIIATKYLF